MKRVLKKQRIPILLLIALMFLFVGYFLIKQKEPVLAPNDMIQSSLLMEIELVGGIGGFCDNILINENNAYGESKKFITAVIANKCRNVVRGIVLSDEDEGKIMHYVQTYKNFELEEGNDSNTPDGMYQKITFNGRGQQEVSDEAKAEIRKFLMTIFVKNRIEAR